MKIAGLQTLSKKLDEFLRFLDLRSRRTAGGWMENRLHIDRHTPAALLLPSGLCALLVLGAPTLARFGIALISGALVCAVLIWQMRKSTTGRWPVFFDLLVQAAMVLALALAIWIWTPSQYQEVGPYRHTFIPVAAAIAIALLLGAALLGPIFSGPLSTSKYPVYFKRTELFASPGEPLPFSAGAWVAGSIAVVLQAPLALLTLPAIATLIVPPVWIPFVLILAGGLCVVALLLAGRNDRFGTMWLLIQENFFKGGAFAVSLLIIVLAGLRLWGITYVTTIFDSAAWWTIATAFVTAYVMSWWFDYWSHRMLTDRMLRFLDPDAKGLAKIPYTIRASARRTSVPALDRVLQVHGAARFIVINEANKTIPPYFQAHRPMQLIELLATCGGAGGKAVPTPSQIAARVASYQAVTGLAFVAIVALGMWWIHLGEQSPSVRLTLASGGGGIALQDLLARKVDGDKNEPLIVLAASGGGTRAAVYTAAVLEGLARQGKAGNVVLGSGVSGGGAALAYFAGHRKALVAGEAGAWDRYFQTMTQPFIQDVLQRSNEWRMVSSGRLGMLLSESFKRRWNLPADRNELVDVSDMGLIFNTSLAGHFERPKEAQGSEPLYVIEPTFRDKATKSTLAGGRLLLTNLSFPKALVSKPLEPDATLALLPVIIRSPQLRLEDAAALNANFPPVFSNAAIDVGERIRYWVTDGGAVDNRGMEMLLYAVRLALETITDEQLPRLHIVVADASAFSTSYAQDRGISTMTGAGARYASHLDAELVEAIRSRYARASHPDRFQFSYVMMPDLLRESGSFGTHWMLQDSIEVHHGKESATVSGDDMVKVIRALHSGEDNDFSPVACQVLDWSRKDIGHSAGWGAVVKAIGGTDKAPTCKAAH